MVYGDIGTSLLYAMRESFAAEDIAVGEANVLGILSLVFWSLMFVITLRHALFILRADDDGEGGILALASLTAPLHRTAGRGVMLLILGLSVLRCRMETG